MEALETETKMSDWNDSRLDHLEGRVDEGFKRMDRRFADTPTRKEMSDGFKEVNARLDKLSYALLAGAIGIIAALIGFHA